jgi:hypothetical protein
VDKWIESFHHYTQEALELVVAVASTPNVCTPPRNSRYSKAYGERRITVSKVAELLYRERHPIHPPNQVGNCSVHLYDVWLLRNRQLNHTWFDDLR